MMITHVAVKCGDRVYSLPKPARHPDVIRLAIANGERRPIMQSQQGFCNSYGSFLTRAEAMRDAIISGQVERSRKSMLYSEDLW